MLKNIAVSVLNKGDFFESTEGMVVRTKALFDVISKHHHASLIVRTDKEDNLNNVFPVKPANTRLWNLKLIPIIMRGKFDYVYCVGDRFGFITYYLLSKIYKYKIIFGAEEVWSEVVRQRKRISPKELPRWQHWLGLVRALDRFAIEHSDYVIGEAGYICEFYRKYQKNVELVPLFVNEDIFSKCEIDRKSTKKGHKRVGIIGPFDIPRNRYSLEFLYNNLPKFDSRIELVVVGKCDHRIEGRRLTYTGYLESVENYVSQLSLLDAIIMVGKKWDIGPFVHVLECMACSLPVFATPQGAFGLDHIQPGKDIFVFSEDELVDEVNQLIFDDTLMEQTGNKAQVTVEKYYSRRAVEDKLVKILEDMDKVS